MFDKLLLWFVVTVIVWMFFQWLKSYFKSVKETEKIKTEILMNCFWEEFENKIKDYNNEKQFVKEKIFENCKEKYIKDKSENY